MIFLLLNPVILSEKREHASEKLQEERYYVVVVDASLLSITIVVRWHASNQHKFFPPNVEGANSKRTGTPLSFIFTHPPEDKNKIK